MSHGAVRLMSFARPLARLLALLAVVAGPASAQMLPSGTWTGTLASGGDRYPVETTIERCATGFTLALTVAGQTADVPETAPATWRRGRLRFTTSRLRLPGTLLPRPLVCDLQADDDGTLAGICTSGSRRVRLALAPPPDATIGCDG